VAAREDWLPEGPAEREGRENCGRRFRETDFAAENFQRLGTWQGLGSQEMPTDHDKTMFSQRFHPLSIFDQPNLGIS